MQLALVNAWLLDVFVLTDSILCVFKWRRFMVQSHAKSVAFMSTSSSVNGQLTWYGLLILIYDIRMPTHDGDMFVDLGHFLYCHRTASMLVVLGDGV